MSETLIHEIKGHKIRVTVRILIENIMRIRYQFELMICHQFQSVSPGIVATEFFDNCGLDPNFLDTVPSLKPEDVANSIVHVISIPQHVQITELTIKPLGQL